MSLVKSAEIFAQIVQERRSVRIYDETLPFDGDAVARSLERAVLSPNSSNLQLWEFYRVKTKEKKQELAGYCLGQKAAKTANELIVIVTRKDKWKERATFVLNEARKEFPEKKGKRETLIETYYEKLIPMLYGNDPFGLMNAFKQTATFGTGMFQPISREVTSDDMRVVVHKSAALAAQTFMLSMKAEGYDSCPMEGFDSKRVKNFLRLPKEAEICMIISVGTAKPEGIYGKRVRVDSKDVIFHI